MLVLNFEFVVLFFVCIILQPCRIRNRCKLGQKLHHPPTKKNMNYHKGILMYAHNWLLLGEVYILTLLNPAHQTHVIENNEQVRKNQYILKCIICCVKVCSAFDLALRCHHKKEELKIHGIFREFVKFFCRTCCCVSSAECYSVQEQF